MLQNTESRDTLPQITALCFNHLQDGAAGSTPSSVDSLRTRIPAYPLQKLKQDSYSNESEETLWRLAGLALPPWPEDLISDQLTHCHPWTSTEKRKIFRDRSNNIVVEIFDWHMIGGSTTNRQVICTVEQAILSHTKGNDEHGNIKKTKHTTLTASSSAW